MNRLITLTHTQSSLMWGFKPHLQMASGVAINIHTLKTEKYMERNQAFNENTFTLSVRRNKNQSHAGIPVRLSHSNSCRNWRLTRVMKIHDSENHPHLSLTHQIFPKKHGIKT